MKYLRTDPYSPAGPLIPKRRAPKCVDCGRVLWRPSRRGSFEPEKNEKGERLGYVPMHRGCKKSTARCFNSKACAKRIVGKGLNPGPEVK